MKSSLIFLSGISLGILVGIFIAPEPGKETLRKVKEEADGIVDKFLKKKGARQPTQQTETTGEELT